MEQRNLILAIVVSMAILLSWQILVEGPRIERERIAQEAAQAQQKTSQKAAPAPQPGAAPPVPGGVSAPVASGAQPPAVSTGPSREEIVGRVKRVALKSERLSGSISTRGARIDDLILTEYRETTDKDSAKITLLSPPNAANSYFARFGWAANAKETAVPDENTAWKADRSELSPEKPVTLTWDNGQGLEFKQIVSVDENYMFTITQRVTNNGTRSATLSPFGLVSRTGTPETLGFYILHEGLLGVFDEVLEEIDYDDLQEDGKVAAKSKGGWIGITDKFWLAALIPDQKGQVGYRFNHSLVAKEDKYQVDFLNPPMTVAPGRTIETTDRLFAGAKVVRIIDAYEENLKIPSFWKAIDFGWFHFLTRPIFYALEYLYRLVGNFGIAILLLTVGIKILFFPLANKSYKSMSRLKVLQPKMVEIKERFKDDRAKQNQAMMELYKKENANPMSGCLPIVIQIPVFFALYKVLYVTIEMRHAPFFGWIQDLSAPDPLGLLTGFGLVQWDVPQMLLILNIGIWPIIMGLTMFLQQKLNPAPADPFQAKVFMFLPLIFTFMLGQFPAGLVIYWAWNNLLSITQQWIIMRRMGVTASGKQLPVGGAKVGPKGSGAPPGATAGPAGAGRGNGAQAAVGASAKKAKQGNGTGAPQKRKSGKRNKKSRKSANRPESR